MGRKGAGPIHAQGSLSNFGGRIRLGEREAGGSRLGIQ